MSEKIIDAEFEEVAEEAATIARVNVVVEIERLKTERDKSLTMRSSYRWLCASITIVVSSTVVSCARMCEAIAG